jgi:predicted dehydrogenase
VHELRIGTLGAARITPAALIRPARQVPGAVVTAVAARDPDTATRFAAKHGIDRVHTSYDALVEDPDIDAVYNPLPNSLHGHWTLRALAAGKHVLCEKPFTANADEARTVAEAAADGDRVVMEAFHYRYHPLARRMSDIAGSGVLGEIRHIETSVCFPLLSTGDIRYQLGLAGGATMDAGCYAIHMARLLGGGEPEVTSATAKLSSPGVDRALTARLRFPGGVTARITCSMRSVRLLSVGVRVVGDKGSLHVINPLAPHLWNRVTIRTGGTRTAQRVAGEPTYTYQLRAFVAAVTDGTPTLTPPGDSVANMTVVDNVYRAAGLEPRRPSQ